MVTSAPRTAGEAPAEFLPDALRRAAELLLAEAASGTGGLLVVDGCRAGALAALADGVPVLSASGAESEAALPYAALADVLEPIVHLAATIPEPQAEALRSALALAAPAGDIRLAVCAGTRALLAAAAPVVVAIDDAQWLDEQSAEALNFAFRRLGSLRVAAIVSYRSGSTPGAAAEAAASPRQLLERAGEARAAGQPDRALRLLDETLACTNDPLVRADAQHLRGLISLWRAAPAQASRELLAEAARIEELDPGKAAWMTADAAWAAVMAGGLDDGLAAATRAGELAAQVGGMVEVLATGLVGVAQLLRGRTNEARPLIERFAPLVDDAAFLERAPAAAWPAALALVWLEEYDHAREAFRTLADVARIRATPALLPPALVGLSELEFRLGDWTAARAAATEAARIAEETGQPVAHAFALLGLARVAAAQGREAECTAHVFEAVRLAPSGAGAVLAHAGTHLGALELALGRGEATMSHLEQVAERAVEHGLEHPGVLRWAPDLLEAQLRCGRVDEARATLDRFEAQAAACGGRWAPAAAARCRGQLAPADSFEEAFLEALSRLGGSDPFDRARTELAYGERLRRARRRTDARIQLRSALTAFERLGALPWAERAAVELRATGETVRSSDAARTDELTAQELEIARLVAGGATNREAATALFLSPKTIEAHLSRIYRKLRIRSRTELARRLA